MKRTKLRFLFIPVWITNICIQFGLLYSVLPKSDGELSLRWLSTTLLLLLSCIVLIRDLFIYRRVIFLRIIAVALLFFSLIYAVLIFVKWDMNSVFYLSMLIPTLPTGLIILKDSFQAD